MDIIRAPELISVLCRDWRTQGLSIALVPTMGFFHQGHLSLMSWAGDNADKVVTSIFVNPAQFGPAEDMEQYPHDLKRDCLLAEQTGVDVVFSPQAKKIYRPEHCSWIEVNGPAKGLCGGKRPGHFRGVATIVAKLFNLIVPDLAVFGQKDWQQLAVIHAMVRDLNFPLRIEGRPTIREPDGLAMSSRNIYLNPQERAQAHYIYKGLQLARNMAEQGAKLREIEKLTRTFFNEHMPAAKLDYMEFVDKVSMAQMDSIRAGTLLAVALFIGRTRLIDNILLS